MDKNKKKIILTTVVGISILYLLMILLVFFLKLWWNGSSWNNPSTNTPDTLRVTVVDTITYYQPVPRDSVVVRYVTRVLPASSENKDTCSGENYAQIPPENMRDSVAVEIPITQKKYETQDYRAYVSGYEPNLDSIFLYKKTITETITLPEKKPSWFKDRFGFGAVAGAGYGIIHKQPDIFVGGAVYFKIWP